MICCFWNVLGKGGMQEDKTAPPFRKAALRKTLPD
jgi:hypothetical protein